MKEGILGALTMISSFPGLTKALRDAFARLRPLYLPRRYRIGAEGLRTLDGEGSARLADVIVGRELCLYLPVDATQVPTKQRAGFIAIAVKRAAPFTDPAWDVSWSDGHASIWYWSMERVSDAVSSLPAKRIRYLAEPRFIGQRLDDGVDALALEEGFVARAWRQGRLVADRWWAEEPDPTTWSRFLRGAGFASDASIPAAQPASIQRTAWDAQRTGAGSRLLGQFSASDWLMVPLLASCLIVGVLLGAMVRNALALTQLRAEVESLTASAGQILDARSQAEDGLKRIEALLALRPAAQPSRMAASLAAVLDGQEWTIRSFALDSSGQMIATLELASVDPASLVRSLEGSGTFIDATVEIVPNSSQVVLRARVRGGDVQLAIPGEGT